jgi:hypothetical protein
MKSRSLAVLLGAVSLALPATAQGDRILFTDGTSADGVTVISFTVKEIKYTAKNSEQARGTDQVAKVELGKFKEVFARGLTDPDLLLTQAREQLETKEAKAMLLAQIGFTGAASRFFNQGNAAAAVGALEEMQKAMPDAGMVPDVYRQKFEYYIGLGGKGAGNAQQVAKKYQADAIVGAWPNGFALEAEFVLALAERMAGGNPKDFQGKLQAVIAKAAGTVQFVADRANVQLAHSLRETKDKDRARQIYDDLARRDGVDVNSRAGSMLGLGLLMLEDAGSDKELARKALLMFLRVHLETSDCWQSLQGEALYHAILAADKWRGSEYQYVMARCRGVLFNEFKGTEWEQKARGR